MSTIDYLIIIIASAITVLVEEMSYLMLSRKQKIKLTFYNTIVLLISGIFITINTYMNDNISRIIISFIIILLTALIIFKDKLNDSFFYALICHVLVIVYEIILSIIVLNLVVVNISEFENNVFLKAAFSFVNLLLVYLTTKNKLFYKVIDKIYKKTNSKYFYIVLVVFVVILILIDFKNFITLSNNIYILNLIILICALLLFISNIDNYFKAIKENEKTETLLNFMSKYEKIIDDDRINRHEMLNNLLFLKSFKDKNTSDYNDALDSLIDTYNKNGLGIKNIYKLPTGLKGIIYYKLNELKDKDCNININISSRISNEFKKISKDQYIIVYKIVGILLDNAIEASLKSKEKYIGINIYKENPNVIICIDNTFKGKIDLGKINNKNYSTNGENRGLGLYITNNLLKNNNSITLNQSVNNNIFVSLITIKKESNN